MTSVLQFEAQRVKSLGTNAECYECSGPGPVARLGTDVGVRFFCESCFVGRTLTDPNYCEEHSHWYARECPMCQKEKEEAMRPVPEGCTGYREGDGAIVHDDDACPLHYARPRISFRWTDEDSAWVIADYPSGEDVKIGTIGWNGGEWFFWRLDKDDEIVMDGGHHIEVDREQEDAFRRQHAENLKEPSEAVRDALNAELQGRRKALRDETRDLAEFGARIEARKWWPEYIDL